MSVVDKFNEKYGIVHTSYEDYESFSENLRTQQPRPFVGTVWVEDNCTLVELSERNSYKNEIVVIEEDCFMMFIGP